MDQQDNLPREGMQNDGSVPPSGDAQIPQNAPFLQNNVENTEKSYTFRWSYADQQAFDSQTKQKAKKRGPITFAIVMVLAFAACIGLMIGVLIWNEHSTSPNTVQSDLSVSEVADTVIPATVFITATEDDGSGAYGTGFFVRSDGYIVTNYHIVAGATKIQVTLTTGQNTGANLIGYSATDDIAVLKVSGNNYPALSIGNSDALSVGETVVAVGHPLGIEAPWSTTVGVISALNRQITVQSTYEYCELTMIQTDAALNPGNSGGPICNLRGEVVGIVTRKLRSSEGLGLALPINGCMEIVETIIKDGHSKNVVSSISKTRPNIGISCVDITRGETYTMNNQPHTAEADGVLITAVDSSYAAYKTLKTGDILIAIDGVSVTTMAELKALLYQYSAGDTATVTVIRNGEQKSLSLMLGAPNQGY